MTPRLFPANFRAGLLRLAVPLYLMVGVPAHARILDTVVFGDDFSETSHSLTAPFTRPITGGLGQPARKIHADPADPKTEEGGHIDVTMKCDPLADNFVTLKLWGGDFERNSGGAILLYLMEDGRMCQVGFRDIQVGEYSPLAWGSVGAAPIPERFYYSTIPLPLSMTQGRTSVRLRIVGTGVGPMGSPGVYRAYVHQGSYFVPAAADPQSPAPAPAPIRPAGMPMAEMVEIMTSADNARIKEWMEKGEGDPAALLRAYQDPESPAYRKPAAIRIAVEAFTRSFDETARKYFKNPKDAGEAWGGSYGNQGMMIADTGAANFGRRLDEVVDLGDPAGPSKRRVLWAKMLKASRDSGRFNRLGPTSAQSMLGDKEIYRANKGLQVLASPDALPEPLAARYLMEASGLEPWRGSDLREGGSAFPMGTNYFEVSPAGLTKENGYVSAYGEVYDVVSGYYEMSRDPRLRPQLLKLLKARSYMRYPMVDADGFRVFQMVGPLDWRSHQTFPIDWAYGERKNRLSVAPVTNDPMAVGFAKQLFGDNQGGNQASRQMLTWKDSGIRLPMTEGRPDFAWADVDNGLVAIKRGEELTWIETFWQSRGGVHSTGRAMQITPTDARVSHIRINTQLDWSGRWRAQDDTVQWSGSPFESYLGTVHQAYFNEKYLEAAAPDYAPGSRREEFIGRASFYAARYGRYLVGINMDKTKAYALKTPAGFTSATDLITKTVKSGVVSVAPFSAVVLDLGTNEETAPLPNSPRFISAQGVPGGIFIMWNTVGGASSYILRRSTSPDGPYTTAATGIGGTYPAKWGAWPSGSFVDTRTSAGTTYYYRVAGVNENGESYPSPLSAGATPAEDSADSLPAPWANVKLGTRSGSASFDDGTFTLNANSGDIGGGADRAHFVYHPLAGDGGLTVRLADPNGSTQAGLVVRKSLAANSPFAGIIHVPEGLRSYKRDNFDENIETMPGDINGVKAPVWLRLQRLGLTYTSWYAPDVNGAPGAWAMASSFKIDDGMDGVTYIGMITNGGKPEFDKIDAPEYGTAVPTAPAGLVAVAGNQSIVLHWEPASRATSYTIKRAVAVGGPYLPVAQNISGLTHTISGLANGTVCHFAVSAMNAVGKGADSKPVSAAPLAIAAPPDFQAAVSGTEAVIKWTASAGSTGYTVRRSLDGFSWEDVGANLSGTTFTDSALVPGRSCYYSVRAVNADETSPPSPPVVVTPVPAAPDLRQTDGAGGEVKLVWGASAGAVTYQVWRSGVHEGDYTKVGVNIPTPYFTDKSTSRGSDYFYRITAVNAAGASKPSAALKAGWGTGLLGKYFNSQDLSGNVVFERIDQFIFFDWGQYPPAPGMNENFSVRWTGQIEAPVSGKYTFSGTADDSIKAFIDDKQVVGESLDLVAGRKYPFRVEFLDREGAGHFTLYWQAPAIPRQPLPASGLYPSDKP